MVGAAYDAALRRLWVGKLTVIVREVTKNPDTMITEFTEKEIIANEPCRLSFSSVTPTQNTVGAAEKPQETKVFCAAALDIPAGSKLVIEQNGRVAAYSKSGEAAHYTYHQEIPLKLFERWT